MPRLAASSALLGLVFALSTTSASANGPNTAQYTSCANHDSMKSYLQDKFAEVPVSVGLQADGRLLQVFASEQSGTWSIVATTPGGLSCIVAVGEAWQVLPTGPLAGILDPKRQRTPS
jgi:hypothetical protein